MQWLNIAMQITFLFLIIGIEHTIEALTCYVCSSDELDICATLHMIQKEDVPSELCPPNVESCFSRIENGTTIRGCSSPQRIESLKEDHYELCKTDKCNGDIFTGRCQSDEIVRFALCYSGQQKFIKRTCESFDDTCFTYIKGLEVIKGCTMEYLMENDLNNNFFWRMPNSKYEICDKPLCNSQVIEQSKCYACESESDLNCVSGTLTEEMTKKCSITMHSSNCYHFIDVNVTRRGCVSDLVDDDLLDECKKADGKCKQCEGDLCNSLQKFQKCSTCGTGPTTCNSVICKDYRDRCYTHVNQLEVRRGCLSKVNENNDSENDIDIVGDCENDDSICKTCSGEDNCNQKQVSEEYCIVCDSDKSADCILNPKVETMRTKCPLAMKTLGCFIALENELRVVRGCMSSLGHDRRKSCNEDNEICKSCNGDSCNEQIHFFSCSNCDSTTDPKCIKHPDNMNIISCLNSKKCYTEIRDGAVKRGCIGDENIPAIEKCLGPICESCNDKMNCNNRPVPVEKCVKCDSKKEGEEWCHSDSIDPEFRSKDCNLEAVQRGCFHHINDDGFMERGCVNQLENDSELIKDCTSNSDTCKICHGKNCNSKKIFPKCLYCNYLEQTQCAIQPSDNKIISRICASYMDQCFTSIENKNVIRGCLSDFEPEHLRKCLDNKETCAVCDPANRTNCNDKKLELERCIECDSDINGEECRSNSQKFEGKICNRFRVSQPEGCFLYIDGDHYKRGCISELLKIEKKNCLSQSSTCKTSFGSNSNNQISFLECYKCDSRDAPECSRESTSETQTEICRSLDATCTTGIDDYGVTHRRCTRQNGEKNLKYHTICNTPKCNGDIYPKNRLQCYQCNGDDECNLMPLDPAPDPASTRNSSLKWQLTKSLEKLTCNVLSMYDQCYTYIDQIGQMHRGCLTDPTDSRLLCELYDTICVKCNKSGCNNQPKLRKSSLKCIHCKDNLECAYGQNESKSKECEKQVFFNANESCYARSLSNGTIFDRGCTVDLMEKELNFLCTAENNCSKCDTPDCNTKNIIQRYCQRCSSLIDGDCIYGHGGKNFMVLCDGEPYPYIKSGCYTYVKDHNVERGCVKDLKEKYDECLQESELCVFCDTDNCNIENHSLAHRITSTVMLNVFTIFLIFSYF